MPAKQRPGVFVSCFEIYGPKCQDLLNNRERLEVNPALSPLILRLCCTTIRYNTSIKKTQAYPPSYTCIKTPYRTKPLYGVRWRR